MRPPTALSTLALGALTAGLLAVPGQATADPTPAPVTEITRTATYAAGDDAVFTVPAGVTSLAVHAVGGRGGSATSNLLPALRTGGRAMGVDGVLPVTPGQKVAVRVAGNGGDGSATGAAGSAGSNGGAAGGSALAGWFSGGGGGGASDLRLCSTPSTDVCDALTDRVLVAGGGGGAGSDLLGLSGGGDAGQAAAGLLSGLLGGGQAGLPQAGGTGGLAGLDLLNPITAGLSGLLSLGGPGAVSNQHGAGGGGAGLFGGGGGAANLLSGAGGGGGSSLLPTGMLSSLVSRLVDPVVELTYTITAPFDLAVTNASPIVVHSDGYDSVDLTLRLTGAGAIPLSGQILSITSSDAAITVGAVSDNGDGTYTVTVQAPTGASPTVPPTLNVAVPLLGLNLPVPVSLQMLAKPGITGAVTPAANPAGWRRGAVVATWTCTQGTAPLGSGACPSPTSIGEGSAQSVTGRVTDSFGQSSEAVIGGLKVDSTKPTVKVKGATKRKTYAKARTLTCKAKDTLSGVKLCKVSVKRKAYRGYYVMTWTGSAKDRAGNTATTQGWYKIRR